MAELKLFLGGDMMIGRGLDQVMRQAGDPTLQESWVESAVCVSAAFGWSTVLRGDSLARSLRRGRCTF